MSAQLRLPGVDPPKHLQPAAERPSPAFWLRRIAILRELRAEPEHVVRDVELRRGLNVVWTPPGKPDGANALFRSGVAGHTAGKSTLCRLIRHVLGEQSFATERTRRRIREKLPNGWVLAEVVVGDVDWGVARPFGIGPHPFCVAGGSVQQVVAGGERASYDVFLQALAGVTLSDLPSKTFPTGDRPVLWEHVLPWLSRDQECRFADFLEWRHSTSDAESPSLTVDERQFVVRTVLGLISDAERAEQLRNAQLVNQRKEEARWAPLRLHQATTDHARVEELLGAAFPPPSTDLFAAQTSGEVQRRRSEIEARMTALSASDPRPVAREVLDRAIEAETNARRDLEDVDARLRAEEGALEQLSPTTGGSSLLASLPPPREYCNVPLTLARDQGCPLASARPVDLAAKRSERSTAEELEAQRNLVAALGRAVDQKRVAQQTAAKATTEARRVALTASTKFEEQRQPLLEERARMNYVARLVRDAEKAWSTSRAHDEAVERLTHEIDASYKKQEEIRREGRTAMERFSATFDYVLRAMLGDDVEGRVDASGRSLALIVEHRGERESAAIDTVKLLAFDLAALTASVEGRGTFPRFLLHDGPREADMSPDIYERFFLYARQLENCFSGPPSFQYIVTTTTQPPEEVLSQPWCRLTLSGVPAEDRLLRCDL